MGGARTRRGLFLFLFLLWRLGLGEDGGDFHAGGDCFSVFLAGFEFRFLVGSVNGVDHVGVVEFDDVDVSDGAFGGDDESEGDLGGGVAFFQRRRIVGLDAAFGLGGFVDGREIVYGFACGWAGPGAAADGAGEGERGENPEAGNFHEWRRVGGMARRDARVVERRRVWFPHR